MTNSWLIFLSNDRHEEQGKQQQSPLESPRTNGTIDNLIKIRACPLSKKSYPDDYVHPSDNDLDIRYSSDSEDEPELVPCAACNKDVRPEDMKSHVLDEHIKSRPCEVRLCQVERCTRCITHNEGLVISLDQDGAQNETNEPLPDEVYNDAFQEQLVTLYTGVELAHKRKSAKRSRYGNVDFEEEDDDYKPQRIHQWASD